MPFKYLKTSVMDGVALVEMARPPVNAFDRDMYIEVAQLFSEPDSYLPNVAAIVLTGQGKHFCGGNDLDEFATMTPENGGERMWRVREAFFAIQDCPAPVIAAVRGAAVGTGLAVAASCDFIIAAEDASFGLPELRVGVMGGARHLARIAPQPLVRRMFLTSENMPASEFAAAGGAVVVCPTDRVVDVATAYARKIAAHSVPTVRIGKQILNRIETMTIRSGYEFEQGFTVSLSGAADSKEALGAFRERRKPAFTDPLVASPARSL